MRVPVFKKSSSWENKFKKKSRYLRKSSKMCIELESSQNFSLLFELSLFIKIVSAENNPWVFYLE
jgi:hypothetical protein